MSPFSQETSTTTLLAYRHTYERAYTDNVFRMSHYIAYPFPDMQMAIPTPELH